MRFSDFRYIYPPRVKVQILDFASPAYQAWHRFPDAVAQYKVNGQRNLLYIDPDRNVEFWGRHGEPHKGYKTPSPLLVEQLQALPLPPGWVVLDGELWSDSYSKVPQFKHCLYLFDALVWGGEYLVGSTYQQRQKKLWSLWGTNKPFFDFPARAVNQIFLAPNVPSTEWQAAWARCQDYKPCEGLVLKRLTAPLQLGFADENNTNWQAKIRKGTKNFVGAR